jgi:hypothetical protein
MSNGWEGSAEGNCPDHQLSTPQLWRWRGSAEKVARAFASQMQRVKRFALLELLGFFIIFTCMILMRFGV